MLSPATRAAIERLIAILMTLVAALCEANAHNPALRHKATILLLDHLVAKLRALGATQPDSAPPDDAAEPAPLRADPPPQPPARPSAAPRTAAAAPSVPNPRRIQRTIRTAPGFRTT